MRKIPEIPRTNNFFNKTSFLLNIISNSERGENMQKMTLKMLRVANGLNQKEAAELVGVSG